MPKLPSNVRIYNIICVIVTINKYHDATRRFTLSHRGLALCLLYILWPYGAHCPEYEAGWPRIIRSVKARLIMKSKLELNLIIYMHVNGSARALIIVVG